MFLLNGVTLPIDACFTDPATGIQYPANWLRLASPEERAAIGITEQPEPAWYDQRFYWNPELPKEHDQLVEQWVQQTRTTANTLLAPTDWMVIREADNGKAMDAVTKAERQRIREAAGTKIAAINATTTTAELAAYITSAAYSSWSAPEPEPEAPVVFSSNTTTSAFG
jgi:hypothetical protein